MNDYMEKFHELSVALTGFKRIDLAGTGVGPTYYETANAVVGETIFQSLLDTFQSIQQGYDGDPSEMDQQVRIQILADARIGPVARNIIKMWYVGTWYQLPSSWREQNGTSAGNFTHVVSASAYREGLVWTAMGAHPMGAKQPGFGTWRFPPVVSRDDSELELER